ncbi:MAG: hypothetical protein QOE06_2065 [Thermoleophilaceae bacterium]|jgi:hypothetical protein|nr:hypothetical protein [Thermoleophilaceae bacterium]
MPAWKPILLAALLAPVLALAIAPAPARAGDRTSLARATTSYGALQKYLYVPSRRLYRGSPYSFVWPFSQAFAATVAMGSLPGVGGRYDRHVRDRIAGLGSYWNPDKKPPGYEGAVRPPLGKGGDIGYDDNEWIGLELLRRYQRTHATSMLNRAKQLFSLVVFGWDTDPTHPCPGGVLFSQALNNRDRNTVSNAPGVELGLRLFQVVHDPYYLDWSKRFYNWVQTCMLSASGLYEDHIDFDGAVDRTIWSYNQGTMIGSNVLMWKVTGRRGYLRRAQEGANTALGYFTPSRLRSQPPFFVAIFMDNLLALDAVRPRSAYRAAVRSYANWAWRARRSAQTGLFNFQTDGGRVLEQAAMVRIYAALAGAASPV